MGDSSISSHFRSGFTKAVQGVPGCYAAPYDKNMKSVTAEQMKDHGPVDVQLVKPTHGIHVSEDIRFEGRTSSQDAFKPKEYSRRGIVPPMSSSLQLGDGVFHGKTHYGESFKHHKEGGDTATYDNGYNHYRSTITLSDAPFASSTTSREDFKVYKDHRARKLMRPDNRSCLPINNSDVKRNFQTDYSKSFNVHTYSKRKTMKPETHVLETRGMKFEGQSNYASQFAERAEYQPKRDIMKPKTHELAQTGAPDTRDWTTDYRDFYHDKPIDPPELHKPIEGGILDMTQQLQVTTTTSQDAFQAKDYSRRGIVPPMASSLSLGDGNFYGQTHYTESFVGHKEGERDTRKSNYEHYKSNIGQLGLPFTATTTNREGFLKHKEPPRKLMRPDTLSNVPFASGGKFEHKTLSQSQYTHHGVVAKRTSYRPAESTIYIG